MGGLVEVIKALKYDDKTKRTMKCNKRYQINRTAQLDRDLCFNFFFEWKMKDES